MVVSEYLFIILLSVVVHTVTFVIVLYVYYIENYWIILQEKMTFKTLICVSETLISGKSNNTSHYEQVT